MITVNNVRKDFGSFTALKDVSCNVGNGSIYGLVGYNGSGKTTLLKIISGVYEPDEGGVLINGGMVFDNETVKRRIFFVPDDLFFLPQASLQRMARFYTGYYPQFSMETFHKLVEMFELSPRKRINGFSKGMQRQAALILALSARPDCLLLDESFDGLDPVKRSLVRQVLTELIVERDTSVIISSHNLRELEDLCDHIGLMNQKHIVMECGIGDVSANRNKFRIAFQDEFPKNLLDGIPHRNEERSGKILTFVATGDPDEITAKLSTFHPALLEIIPLSLEEVFLSEMEAKSYDFTDLFK